MNSDHERNLVNHFFGDGSAHFLSDKVGPEWILPRVGPTHRRRCDRCGLSTSIYFMVHKPYYLRISSARNLP